MTSPNTSQKPLPRVGDDVLYVSYGTPGGEFSSEVRAAKVTQAGAWVTISDDWQWTPAQRPRRPQPGEQRILRQEWRPDAALLCVINPGGFFLNADHPIPYHTGRDTDGQFVGFLGGSWHWPADEPDGGSR